MKTVESSTKRILGKLLIDSTIAKITNLASQEFNNLRYNSQNPVCVEFSPTHYIVGSFNIISHGDHCWTVSRGDQTIHSFYSKTSAIYYCVFESVNQYTHSDNIYQHDRLAGKYYDDYEFYRQKLNKNKNAADYETRLHKFHEAKTQYILAREELTKTLNLAKYYKVWDKIR